MMKKNEVLTKYANLYARFRDGYSEVQDDFSIQIDDDAVYDEIHRFTESLSRSGLWSLMEALRIEYGTPLSELEEHWYEKE
jgi:hypothetical protein